MTLPAAYRRFISEVADGGTLTLRKGQDAVWHHGLRSLTEIGLEPQSGLKNMWGSTPDLADKPFPLTNFWNWDDLLGDGDDLDDPSLRPLYDECRQGLCCSWTWAAAWA